MSNSIDQKAYLQKYLGGKSGDKKKKKKKAIKGKGFKIIDDDVDLSKLRALDGDELDILDEGEDAPQIAGIIDDRPEEMRKLEQFKTSSKWKVVNQDDGFNSKLQIQEIQTDIKEIEKENEIIFGKMYSDSEDEKYNDSDISPPRKQSGNSKTTKTSKIHGSDSDISPPRKGRSSPNRSKEVDKRKNDHSSNIRTRKPSRWGDEVNNEKTTEYTRDESGDSHRKSKKDSPKRKQNSNSSPPSKSKNYDSDQSPPRKSRKNYDSDVSPPRKPKTNYDSDLPPPRKSRKHSPPRKSRKGDSDESPPRKSKYTDKRKQSESPSPSKRRKYSPERQSKHKNNVNNNKSRKNKHSSDSDLSPPRKKHQPESPVRKTQISENNKRVYNSSPRREKDKRRTDRDSPPPSNKKMAKTLDGKIAGLQDAKQLRNENEAFRRREEDVYNKMSDEVSGRNAKAVSRKGKRETSAEKEKLKEKAERQKVLDEKYKKWSKGLKQLEAQEAQMQDYIHEASKPLARHKDDRDLEDNLKKIERDGDPMLQYMREKKRERGELGPEKPTYKGSFPPNRFNIRPGYRWDGVDRSNGYEKKYFEQQSKKKAQLEEAYKWSTEDL